MYKAGYNLNEAVKFWENMSEGKSGGSDFFSTHQVQIQELVIFKSYT